VSRATRRHEKWQRETHDWACESARQLALDLYYRRASPIDPYGLGVALGPGELLYRQVCARYWTLGQPTQLVDGFGRVQHVPSCWRDWGWCQTLLTSQRLVTRLAADRDRLVSNWWASIAGVQVDLARDLVGLDDTTSTWRGAYGGPAVPLIAVCAVGAVHGLAALVDHPALEPLRREPCQLRSPTRYDSRCPGQTGRLR
jgi:hypothetical protein